MNGTEHELRQQLREAWQKIGDLQWQLESEKRNSRRQEDLLDSQATDAVDVRDKHDQALADWEQDMADREDEHTSRLAESERARAIEASVAERQLSQARGENLRVRGEKHPVALVQQLLGACARQESNSELAARLSEWESRMGVVVRVARQLDNREGGTAPFESALRDVVEAEASDNLILPRATNITVQPGIVLRRDQAILGALLLHMWLRSMSESPADPCGSEDRLEIVVRRERQAVQMVMTTTCTVPVAADVAPTKQAPLLNAILGRLQGELVCEARGNRWTVTIPGQLQG